MKYKLADIRSDGNIVFFLC